MVEAPKRATKFAANEQYTAIYKKMFGVDKMTQPLAILTGVSAGITEAFLIVPFELVKIRMQDKANVSYEWSLPHFPILLFLLLRNLIS
jgi:solute carrier family 25 2-oxodicarboxylate transporter 21